MSPTEDQGVAGEGKAECSCKALKPGVRNISNTTSRKVENVLLLIYLNNSFFHLSFKHTELHTELSKRGSECY